MVKGKVDTRPFTFIWNFNMKTKILYLDHTPFAGGAQFVLADHIACLNKEEFEPVVVCSNTTPTLIDTYKQSGARVVTIDFGKLKILNPLALKRLWQAVLDLNNIILSEKPQILVTNTVRAHIVGSISAKQLKIPLIWILRDYTFPRVLLTLLKNLPVKIFTVSSELVNYYRLAQSGKTETIFVGTNFDNRLKSVKTEQINVRKKELNIGPDTPVIGYVGRLVTWKGAQILVRAMVEVIKTYPKAKAIIIGSGSGQDDSNESELMGLTKMCHLENNVVFLGFVPPRNLTTYFRLFNIFTHTSIASEPFATVVVQAMMAKVPVIGTELGGTPEIITDQKNGLLIAPDEPHQLAVAIMSL